MKKIHFGVFKLRKHFVNILLALMLCCLGGIGLVSGSVAVSSKTNDVYYEGNRQEDNITLMVNVYWGTEYLDQMLDIFDKYNAKTTFFVGGVWAVKNQDYLVKIKDAGHELANHGYHHKDHDKISQQENVIQIKNTHAIVKELVGVEMNLFAPPSGAYNAKTVEIAKQLGYKTIMWTRDTIDWRDQDSDLIYSRAVNNAQGGDLVLMHPTKATLQALERIIETLQDKGLKLTTVSQNIATEKVV